MAVRDVQKGEAAKTALLAEIGQPEKPPTLDVMALDLTSFASIKAFAAAVAAKYDRDIDVLVNNAGANPNTALVSIQ